MSTADLAIVAVTVSSLTQTGGCIYIANRVCDRARLVSPPKAPAQSAAAGEPAATTGRTG